MAVSTSSDVYPEFMKLCLAFSKLSPLSRAFCKPPTRSFSLFLLPADITILELLRQPLDGIVFPTYTPFLLRGRPYILFFLFLHELE